MTKPYGDSGTGKPYVAFTTPIVREGKTIGALSGAVALDGVKAIIQAIHPTPSSLAFVLGSDGQVISHVDDKFALKPATEVAPELKPEALKGLARDGGEPAVISWPAPRSWSRPSAFPAPTGIWWWRWTRPRPRWD